MSLDSKIRDRDPDDPSFASPKRPSPESKLPDLEGGIRRMRIGVIVLAVVTVVVTVAVPGLQWEVLVPAGALTAWAVFGLIVDRTE